MEKQDRVFTRTPAALEQKYDFGREFRETEDRIRTVGKQAQEAKQTAVQADGEAKAARSEIVQLSNSITLTVENGQTTAQIKLKVGDREIPATIDMQGLVTFTNLATAGATRINGDNITTGTILADLIKAGTIKSKDGQSVVIDLDKGTAEITGSYKTVEAKNDSGNVASGELMPAWVRLITKNPETGSNVNFAHFTSHVLELGEGISKNITLLVPEHDSDSDEIKLFLDDLDFGGIDFVVSPSGKSVSADFYNGTDGTNIQVLLKNGRAAVTGLTAPVNAADAATKAYVDKALVEDSGFPGCYYRTVDGNREWLNPPMALGEEYRTTERWRGLPVYRKYMYLGVTAAGTVTLDHGIPDLSGCLEIQLTDSSHQNITHHANIQSLYVTGAGVFITAGTAQTVYATIQYTKT